VGDIDVKTVRRIDVTRLIEGELRPAISSDRTHRSACGVEFYHDVLHRVEDEAVPLGIDGERSRVRKRNHRSGAVVAAGLAETKIAAQKGGDYDVNEVLQSDDRRSEAEFHRNDVITVEELCTPVRLIKRDVCSLRLVVYANAERCSEYLLI